MGNKGKVTDEAHERYLSTRTDYLARERVASEKADQVLLAGAAGALALSVTFIQQVAPTPRAATMWLLGLAWATLVASLAVSLLTYELRSLAYAHAWRELDRADTIEEMDMTKVKRFNRALGLLRMLSLAMLLVGVVLVVVFAFTNIKTS